MGAPSPPWCLLATSLAWQLGHHLGACPACRQLPNWLCLLSNGGHPASTTFLVLNTVTGRSVISEHVQSTLASESLVLRERRGCFLQAHVSPAAAPPRLVSRSIRRGGSLCLHWGGGGKQTSASLDPVASHTPPPCPTLPEAKGAPGRVSLSPKLNSRPLATSIPSVPSGRQRLTWLEAVA